MKKVSIFMAIAAAASLASCTAQAPKANLKTDIDSLSYSIGMAQTQGLKGYLTGRLDVDTTYMAEFIKGLNEGANKTSKKRHRLHGRSANRSANQQPDDERYQPRNCLVQTLLKLSAKKTSWQVHRRYFGKRRRNDYGSSSRIYSYSYGNYQSKSFGRKIC